MRTRWILFLCSGNYYRSRMAEEYFNAHARAQHLDWRADSRGLVQNLGSLGNAGPMSVNARRSLEDAGIHINNGKRYPLAVTEQDFTNAALIIALSRNEHQAMVQEYNPAHMEQVRFWEVEDIHLENPDSAFSKIQQRTNNLLGELTSTYDT